MDSMKTSNSKSVQENGALTDYDELINNPDKRTTYPLK